MIHVSSFTALIPVLHGNFPKWLSGAPLHTLVKIIIYDVPVGFVTPPPPSPSFKAAYCFICVRQSPYQNAIYVTYRAIIGDI